MYPHAAAPGAAAPRLIRVLLVDDLPRVRTALRRWLQLAGDLVVVGEAGDGREALDAIARLRPDVCVMDVRMPGMDGIEATTIAAREAPACSVVMLSLHDEADLRRRALAAGARAYVTKGEHPAVLLGAIRRAFPPAS